MDDRPIGIFDSGLGGLTVLKEIRGILPGEDVVYFGDCGRAPYGIKSSDTIVRYTFQNINFFLETGVKLLVIACNTSSAYAYSAVAGAVGIPVIEVIKPGSSEAARLTLNKKVGVIGTAATVASRAYENIINGIDPEIQVFAKACPLFVPLVEEGPRWWGHESTRIIAEEYLCELRGAGIDCLVLGCTHYPLLGEVIGGVVGGGIRMISSAGAVASEAQKALSSLGLLKPAGGGCGGGSVSLYTSDSPEKFIPFCSVILGEDVSGRVHKLDIDKYESGLPRQWTKT